MIIRRMEIRNFGKINNRTLELSPGINVLYGENESGKTTIHTFIKSMFYGITRQRGRGAKNDTYSTYEPWENPSDYGGVLWFTLGDEDYRLTRNFSREHSYNEIFSETSGAIADAQKGSLEKILGNVSEAIYDNTVSVGQLKSVTGQDLIRELQNYMASYEGTGDGRIDLSRASQMLKMSRKGFLSETEKRKRHLKKEQEKVSANIDYVYGELERIHSRRSSIEKKQQASGKGTEQELERMVKQATASRNRMTIAGILFFAAFLAAAFLLPFGMPARAAMAGAGAFLLIMLLVSAAGKGKEINKLKRVLKKRLARKEKLEWDRGSLTDSFQEKAREYTNLKAEYQECEDEMYRKTPEDVEAEALTLALETIEKLSEDRNRHTGNRLRRRTSEILSEITGGKYEEVLMDRKFRMAVNTEDRIVSLERLSRGTLEQIYFALRMAAGELLCSEEIFPVILDDVFGMYDEDRLAGVLRWLYKENRQIIISTCSRREMEILDREGIPCQKLLL